MGKPRYVRPAKEEEKLSPEKIFTERLGIHLTKREFAAARSVLDQAERELDPKPVDPLEMSVSELSLDQRTINMLESNGISTVLELVMTPRKTLLSVPRCQRRTVERIMASLAEIGIHPADSSSPGIC